MMLFSVLRAVQLAMIAQTSDFKRFVEKKLNAIVLTFAIVQQRQYVKCEPFRAGKKGWGLRVLERVEP